jgi:hypothetical protein
MDRFNEVLINREWCILFNLSKEQASNYGWIGGNRPSYFDDGFGKDLREHYIFLLIVQNPFNKDISYSIFIPSHSSIYFDNYKYPNSAIKLFEHPTSGESNIEERSDFFKNQMFIHHYKNCKDADALEEDYLMKFGGKPNLIQNKTYYYQDLEKDGYKFLFQIEESGFSKFLRDNYIFNYGALYVYAKNIENCAVDDVIIGFSQFS